MIAQYLCNQCMVRPRSKIDRLKRKIFYRFRSIYLKLNDPIIKFTIGSYQMKCNLSNNLPLYISNYPTYSDNLSRIAEQVKNMMGYLSVIDIGANIGDTVAMIKKRTDAKFLCVEGRFTFFNLLKKNTKRLDNIWHEKVYLGEKDTTLNARITEGEGTAHLLLQNNAKASKIKITTFDKLISKYPQFKNANLFKIDTDGYDCRVIRGSLNFLSRQKPILFFEHSPHSLEMVGDDPISIFRTLSNIGYENIIVYDNIGFMIMALNVGNISQIEFLVNYARARSGGLYYDLCAFHKEYEEIFLNVLESEKNYFSKLINGY